MKKIRLLDCTLRDGGRIMDCAFPDDEIKNISNGLAKAGVDIIEMGFLRDYRSVNYIGNSTFFTEVKQISPFVKRVSEDTMYTVFIDYGMFDFNLLESCRNNFINAIRFGFTKKDYNENPEEIVKPVLFTE